MIVVRGEGQTEWAETLDLKPGDRLATADGRGAVFTGAALREGLAQTYNLEVEGLHTFLVGNDGVVVHNGPCDLAKKLALQEARNNPGAREIMRGKIIDKRYPESQWAKMEWVHRGPNGENITIHFWRNRQTGAEHGFKIK